MDASWNGRGETLPVLEKKGVCWSLQKDIGFCFLMRSIYAASEQGCGTIS